MAGFGTTIKIIRKDMTVDEVNKRIRTTIAELPTAMYDLGVKTAENMRTTIRTQKMRAGSSGNLENKIRVYKLNKITGTTGYTGVGVGRIGLLDNKAPYWYLLNYGGMVSPLARVVGGWFLPDEKPPDKAYKGIRGGAGEEFEYVPRGAEGSKKKYVMHVDTPITGIHYIEKAKMFLAPTIQYSIKRILSKLSKRI